MNAKKNRMKFDVPVKIETRDSSFDNGKIPKIKQNKGILFVQFSTVNFSEREVFFLHFSFHFGSQNLYGKRMEIVKGSEKLCHKFD